MICEVNLNIVSGQNGYAFPGPCSCYPYCQLPIAKGVAILQIRHFASAKRNNVARRLKDFFRICCHCNCLQKRGSLFVYNNGDLNQGRYRVKEKQYLINSP